MLYICGVVSEIPQLELGNFYIYYHLEGFENNDIFIFFKYVERRNKWW